MDRALCRGRRIPRAPGLPAHPQRPAESPGRSCPDEAIDAPGHSPGIAKGGMTMLLRLYRSLLRLFPARHRSTFGREMSAVFQQRQADVRNRGMYKRSAFFLREFMSLVSTAIRERARHSELPEPHLAGGAAQTTFDSAPAFYTCEPYFPRRSALLHGGILSLAVFGVASAAFEYGVSHRLFRASLGSSQTANQQQFIETSESGFVAFSRSLVASADGALTLVLGQQPATAAIELKPGMEKPAGLWSNLLL